MPTKSQMRARVITYQGGEFCMNCGDGYSVECDHIWPSSQGGPNHFLNGGLLCGPWSKLTPFPGGCHKAKTDGKLQYDPAWLTPEQLAWLANVEWVDWDNDGLPFGRGYKHFTHRVGVPNVRSST